MKNNSCQNIFPISFCHSCFVLFLLWDFFFSSKKRTANQSLHVSQPSNHSVWACMPVMAEVKYTWGFGDCLCHRSSVLQLTCCTGVAAPLMLTLRTATVSDNKVSNPREPKPSAAVCVQHDPESYSFTCAVLYPNNNTFLGRSSSGTDVAVLWSPFEPPSYTHVPRYLLLSWNDRDKNNSLPSPDYLIWSWSWFYLSSSGDSVWTPFGPEISF